MDNLAYQKYLHLPQLIKAKGNNSKYWQNVAFGGHMNFAGMYQSASEEKVISQRLHEHHKKLSHASQQSMKFTIPSGSNINKEFSEDEINKLFCETEYFLPFKSVTLIQPAMIHGQSMESGRTQGGHYVEQQEDVDEPALQFVFVEEVGSVSEDGTTITQAEDNTGQPLFFGNICTYLLNKKKFINDPNMYMYSFRRELYDQKYIQENVKKPNFIQRIFGTRPTQQITSFHVVKDGKNIKFEHTNHDYSFNAEKGIMETLSETELPQTPLYSFWLDHSPFVDLTDTSANLEKNDTYTNVQLNQNIARIVGAHQTLCMMLQFPQIVDTEEVEGIPKEKVYPVRDGNYKWVDMLRKPKYAHKVLKLNLYDNHATGDTDANGTGSPRSLHTVRKHLRRLPNGKLTWVKAHFRGNREVGIITKDYEIETKR